MVDGWAAGDPGAMIRAMGGARAWARTIRRRRWAGLLLAVVLGGAGLGLVIAAAGAAQRARTAYDRLDDATAGPDAFGDATGLDDATVEQLRDIAGVEGLARFTLVPIAPAPLVPGQDAIGFAAVDPDFLDAVARPLVLEGRLADPDATDEIVINEAMADASGYGPGDRVTLVAGFEDAQEVGDATVVGVVRSTFDVGPSSGGLVMLLSNTAFGALPEPVRQNVQPNAVVRLTDGADGIDGFSSAASELLGQPVQLQSAADGEGIIEDSLDVQATGYWLLAAVAALATALAVGQALARLLGQSFADLPTLRAIGLRPRDRVSTGVLVAVPVAAAGTLMAVSAGWFVSDRMLTAFARSVDPVTDRHLDAGLTAALTVGWVVLALGLGALLAWREGRRRPEVAVHHRRLVPRPPGALDRLGVDAALRAPGRPGGAAARSALVTASVGVAGIVAVVVFGSSLSHLFATPRLQGWSFDAVVQNFEPVTDRQFREQTSALTEDGAVERVAYADLTAVSIEGQPAETVVVEDGTDPLQPTIRTGRAPVADDEVVLGTQALSRAGATLGETVTAEGPAGAFEMTVVGTAAYPMFGNDAQTTRLITITRGAARRLGAEPVYNMALVDLAAGHQPDELRAVADASRSDVIAPFENVSIKNVREVRGFPWLVGGFFAFVAVVTIVHGLLRSVAVRRREFAELSALGLTRRVRRRVVVAQGLTVALIACVVGLVGGIAGGQLAWGLLTGRLGVVDESVVPPARLAAVVATAILVCALTAVAAPRLVRLRTGRDLRASE